MSPRINLDFGVTPNEFGVIPIFNFLIKYFMRKESNAQINV